MRLQLRVGLMLLVACPSAVFADLSGRYVDEADPSIALVLQERNDGAIIGSLEGLPRPTPVHARRSGDELQGTLGEGADVRDVRGKIDGDKITFVLEEDPGADAHVFRRTGGVSRADTATASTPSTPRTPPPTASTSSTRDVIVNGVRLSDQDLARLEQAYRVRIVDAEYWYDKMSGAWGIKGGPTRGFIYSGLSLGGPLAADASGRGTGVFVNGRELHPVDVKGLQRCVQVNPGRYWVGPDGTGGYENGPALFNLVMLCSPPSNGGRAGGWLCDGGSCGTGRTVTGPYAVGSEGDGRAGVYTDSGLILTPN